MPDSETEDEILLRIETALRKIGTLAKPAKPPSRGEIDHAALLKSLDLIIARLRGGLEPAKSGAQFTE